MSRPLLAVAMVVLAGNATVRAADDALPPKAARPVPLSYVLPDGAGKGVVAFYNEVTVEQTTLGSYFRSCGFAGGYFGIQDRGDRKVGIFSVWDTGATGNDQRAVDKKNRVETVFTGPGVRESGFGGEGTGGHTDFDCDWVVGQTYKFYLTATVAGATTRDDDWILDPAKKDWLHVATIACPDGGKWLSGLYSFIEDFRRDTECATEVRRATYGNASGRRGVAAADQGAIHGVGRDVGGEGHDRRRRGRRSRLPVDGRGPEGDEPAAVDHYTAAGGR